MLRFYTEKGERGDMHPGFFLGRQKELICGMFRTRVNKGGLRLASSFAPMCTPLETNNPETYNRQFMLDSLEKELRNFQCKLKFNKTNPDKPPMLNYSGKKGYGFDDIVLTLVENNYFYWKDTTSKL